VDWIPQVATLVAGAIVAGVSAVVKSAFERRDARLTAQRQLDLASKRTDFIKQWLGVTNELGDPAYAADAAARARLGLEQAYQEAQDALARGQDAAQEPWHDRLVDQVRWLFLIRERHCTAARLVVVACHVLIGLAWLGVFALDEEEDGLKVWEYVVFAVSVTIVVRACAGYLVEYLDARHAKRAGGGTVAPPATELGPGTEASTPTAQTA
jgi:hypothetical protein